MTAPVTPDIERVIVDRWTFRGLACATVKATPPGWSRGVWWCGYVRIPEGHPWHGRRYDTIDVDAPYGLTFGEEGGEELGGGWWIGWDTAHGREPSDWARGRVAAETGDLARQAREAA